MAYPISDVPRRIVYSGSVGVGPYAFTFEVLAATDIAVYKNGTLLTLTTDYTVSINTGTGTGTVTLVVAATGSDQITLVGDRAIERTSDFVTGGDLFANTLNTELDSLTIFAQQVDEKADRAIKAPVTDPTTINMTLPAQATRANKILGFNASGNPTQTSNTLVAIDAATTAINEIAAAPSGNAAGISFLQAGSGAVVRTAQSKMRDVVSVKDFGAVGDGVADDTVAIQAAINYLESTATPPSAGPGAVTLFFPFGLYILTDALIVTKSLSFVGEGHSEYSTGARLIQNTFAKDHFKVQPIAVGCSVSWDNLTMTANGGGGTGGSCINVTKTTATCNSVRIRGCTFGTPQTFAINLQSSDDVQIDGNLFDVSATNCIGLGTSAAGDVVGNCAITNNAFFTISNFAILAYNVTGLVIANNRVYKGTGYANLGKFIDGYNTLPYQLKNIVIEGNSFKDIDILAWMTSVDGLSINGNVGLNLGPGNSATVSCIELTGTCSRVNINGNAFSGAFGTKNFYNDSGATVTASSIGQNTFLATSGTGQALVCANTTGSITQNAVTGLTTPSVSEQIYTTGNAISPGVVGSLASSTFTKTITGAKQGDRVTLTPASVTWPAPAGIVISAFISAPNTVSIQYTNVTGSPIGVPAHDFGILVTR
jgi:hypothetical protein